MKSILSVVVFLCAVLTAHTQNVSLYKKQWFIQNGDTMPYRILLPDNFDSSKTYPLVLLLHGAGERGSDNEKQLVHGSKLFLRDSIRKNYPAIVVFPQCPQNSFWSNVKFSMDSLGKRQAVFTDGEAPTIAMRLLQQLLQQVISSYPVNKKQIYVGGLSMGGMGTFEIAARNPKLFAAAFPICGGGAPATGKKIRKINWWVFHGDADAVVPWQWSETMVNALKGTKANVKFTLYPGVNHNSWDNAFAESDLLHWLFAQHK